MLVKSKQFTQCSLTLPKGQYFKLQLEELFGQEYSSIKVTLMVNICKHLGCLADTRIMSNLQLVQEAVQGHSGLFKEYLLILQFKPCFWHTLAQVTLFERQSNPWAVLQVYNRSDSSLQKTYSHTPHLQPFRVTK